MKKLLNILIIVVLILFVGVALFVFELFPFNPGGPFIAKKEGVPRQEELKLPDFLQEEGVSRAKTYDEHMNRGKLLQQNGYSALAIGEFEAAAEMAPTNPSPLIEIGKAHLSTKDLIKAKLNLQEALKLDADNLEASIYLGKVAIADRKIDEAKTIFDSLQVHNQESKYYEGIIAAYTGDHERAKNLLRETINIGGNTAISANAQNFLSAYDEFDANQGGANIHLLTLLGRSYNQTGEYEMAIPLLFEVIKQKKEYRDAWILLGYAYLNTQKYQDAVEALEEARKLDPQKAETLFFLGLGYFGLGDLESAAASLELAKSNGFEPQIQVSQKLAEIYLQMQEYEKAAEKYEDVVSLNDEDLNYFIKPMWIYLDRLNEPEKAVTLANKALAAHPDAAMSYNLVGWALIGESELVKAQQYLDKAASLDPSLDAVYLNYGKLYEKKGDNVTALRFYKKAYERGGGSSISLAAADLYNKLIGKANEVDYSVLKTDLLY